VLKSFRDNLFIALQRMLPARLLGRAVHALARSRNRLVKNLLIGAFVRLYGVDVTEAERPVPAGYASFNEFFTRALKPAARPIDADPASIVSPADGTVQQVGALRGGEIVQAKGIGYGAAELLGDAAAAHAYDDGSYITIYLAPWNYHRVHMPAAGRVVRMTHVPGELWSVNAATAARVPGLLARNERLVCHCVAPWGPFAVVLVGALNVGSISTAWAGEVLPRRAERATHWDYEPGHGGITLGRGALLGQFNMGSTVVVLLPAGAVAWRDGLGSGARVRVGERIGTVLRTEHR
jgi:phosphatidylserine decarboxylase